MCIYYFDLVDGKLIADGGGCKCADLNHAKEIAKGLAIRLALSRSDLIGRGYSIAVRTKSDEEVYRVGIDPLIKLLAN